MAKTGKRMLAAREGIDRHASYPLDEAVKMMKDRGKAKFDETVEISIGWSRWQCGIKRQR